nr:hypothetical protein Iba_chr13aCG9640 [Ipomoea batatas]GMD81351.1 hypothetical protein Iba_chr13eCG10780 [Ipomoea batatas]
MELMGIGAAELYDKHNQADNQISNLALTKPGDAIDGAVKRCLLDEFSPTCCVPKKSKRFSETRETVETVSLKRQLMT